MSQMMADTESIDNGSKISRLEQQYIKLLEFKIATLTASSTLGSQEQVQSSVNGIEPEIQAEISKEQDSAAKDHDAKKEPAVVEVKAKPNGETELPEPKEKAPKIDGNTEEKKPTNGPNQGGAEQVKKSRYNIVIRTWDEVELCRRDIPAELAKEEEVVNTDGKERAFTFKKVPSTNKSEGLVYSLVEIESKPLLDVLNKGLIHVQYDIKDTLSSPFEWIVWNWRTISEEATRSQDQDSDEVKQARVDLQELLKTISTQSGIEQLNNYFSKRETYIKESTITHEALWTIFPPGTVVFAKPVLDQPQLFFVMDHSRNFPDVPNEEDAFSLTCYSYDWNGSTFNRVPFSLEIDHFKDKQTISALPVYPLKYHEDAEGLRRELIARGKKYYKLCVAASGEQMFKYNGPVVCQKESRLFQDPSTSANNQDESESLTSSMRGQKPTGNVVEPSEVRGDVMVDFTSFIRFQPQLSPIMGSMSKSTQSLECRCIECQDNHRYEEMRRYTWDNHPGKLALSDERLSFCPPRVLGYAMRIKRWVQLLVSRTDEPGDASQEIFEKLQLKAETKDMIKSLVLAHDQGKTVGRGKAKGIVDFVEDKGKGLVVMLYGLPGVGKTLTAEGVAMLARKPLFMIGVSDIGTTSQDIERSLADVFELASTWKAVLLIDEADIFLEARDSSDSSLQRNAMVSVLLRILEYYEGILFLTTNRMRAFDIAVQSRIHLAVKYGDLAPDQRKEIFLHFLRQLQKNGHIEEWGGKHGMEAWVTRFSRKSFNGRQIRNIVSAAMCLARYQDVKLTTDHLESVADCTTDFQKDLSDQEAIYRSQQMEKK